LKGVSNDGMKDSSEVGKIWKEWLTENYYGMGQFTAEPLK
jgi:hypothetical protein